ncbi:MAG TPA: CsbD family protein [Bryobacteraceae bacterium]|nr:CsbD family protein [Bryobacteraceae bacterium]
MNADQLNGKWKQLRGAVKQQWGKLTDEDLEVIAGKRDMLIGKLQERYGLAREVAQAKADEWLKTYAPSDSEAHAAGMQ